MGHRVSHAHNLSKRRFNINLQRIRVLVDGRVQHMRVSAKAIKSGLITRPPIKLKERKPRVLEVQPAEAIAAAEVAEAEPVSRFFSEATVVHRLFKPKPAPGKEIEEEQPTSRTAGVPSKDTVRQLPDRSDDRRITSPAADKTEADGEEPSTPEVEPEPLGDLPEEPPPDNEAE